MQAGKVEMRRRLCQRQRGLLRDLAARHRRPRRIPHQTVDPVFILAQVLNAIQGIRARRIDPTKAAALSIGIDAGRRAPAT
jgi:hypothetical protein